MKVEREDEKKKGDRGEDEEEKRESREGVRG